MRHKLSKFPLRFAISGAYLSKFTVVFPPSMPKRGLDCLSTYAPPEIFAELTLEEPIEDCQERQEHYEEHL